ncbi:MAG: CoA transferase [Vicinamibacterales bacterium]
MAPTPSLPLAHVTVLDLSRVLAGPFATMVLAELGATVLKVEAPGEGDETRGFEPFVERGGESVSAYFLSCNRSKRSVTANFRDPDGREVIRDLARQVDVVVENFPVGSLAKYGLDYASLRAINPTIVYLSCTGFGQTGPYAGLKGYDTIFQAMGGMLGLTGEAGGGPVKPGLPVADLSSGLWAASAVLAALVGRQHTGQGCHIDLSMFDAQVSWLTVAAARFFARQEVPPRLGTEHPGRVPSASLRTTDGWIHVSASDQHWPALCRVLGLDDLGADPSLATNAGRLARRADVMQRLAAAVATRERDELWMALAGAGVPAGPVRALDEVLHDPHVRARGLVDSFVHPQVGPFPALRVPLVFDGWDRATLGAPPRLGEDTDHVLASRLGYTAERIAELRRKGAI